MILKKTVSTLFGLAFVAFMAVQYNDPDPMLWMIIYGIAALISFAAAFNKTPHMLLWVTAAIFILGGIYMWPDRFEGVSIGGGQIKNIEEARESLGLFLCAVAFCSYPLLDKFAMRRTVRLQQLQKARWANL